MPIYAYRCDDCGFEKDVLQKISDALLTQCPSCGKDAFRKQVTAAGFQLKGSGWYATDFRGGNGTNGGTNGGGKSAPATGSTSAGETSSDSGKAAGSDGAAAPSASTSTPASTAGGS